MKRIPAIALFAIAAMAAAPGASAQERALEADIPFNFTVGDKTLPAGEYTISSPSSNIVSVQSKDKRFSAMAMGNQNCHEAGKKAELVFNRYGDHHFLHRILAPAYSALNADVPAGKLEKRAHTNEGSADNRLA